METYARDRGFSDDSNEDVARDCCTYRIERQDEKVRKSLDGWQMAWRHRIRDIAPQCRTARAPAALRKPAVLLVLRESMPGAITEYPNPRFPRSQWGPCLKPKDAQMCSRQNARDGV